MVVVDVLDFFFLDVDVVVEEVNVVDGSAVDEVVDKTADIVVESEIVEFIESLTDFWPPRHPANNKRESNERKTSNLSKDAI